MLRVAAFVFLLGVPFLPGYMAAVAREDGGHRGATRASAFAQGIIAIVRENKVHDPREIARRTGVSLRNPVKWLDQPDGTYREARWHSPQNALGVQEVRLLDVPAREGEIISSSANFKLSGSPCVTIGQMGTASGEEVHYGGTVTTIPYHGEPIEHVELSREHASIWLAESSIAMRADRPGPTGCLLDLTIRHVRPMFSTIKALIPRKDVR